MMGFGFVFTLLIIGLVAYVVGWRPQFIDQAPHRQTPQTPLEILKTRYARGEISQEEYWQLRQDLLSGD